MSTSQVGASALDDLAAAVDGACREATPVDVVAGVEARWVASPASTAQASTLLTFAARIGATVVVRGGGTALHWAPPPRSVDLVIDTERLAGVVEHEAGDLVCTVEAGTRIDDLNAQVAGAGQQLALDQPVPGSSVGGTLATSRSGPRRLLYGTPRDLVVGVTMVRADGVVAKAGGKVVKNVAGYDLAKLLGGSYGTLGLVTRMVVRLHPLPPASSWLTASYPEPAAAAAAAASVTASQLAPTAVEIRRPAGGTATDVLVLLEGTERGVAERAAAARGLLGATGAGLETDTDTIARLEVGPGDALVKVAVPIPGVLDVLTSAVDLEQRLGVSCRVSGSAGTGVLYVVVSDISGRYEAAADAVATLRRVSTGGSAVLLQAPPQLRALVDSWGPVEGLELMRRVKAEFDPDHRFAAGRFVGGI